MGDALGQTAPITFLHRQRRHVFSWHSEKTSTIYSLTCASLALTRTPANDFLLTVPNRSGDLTGEGGLPTSTAFTPIEVERVRIGSGAGRPWVEIVDRHVTAHDVVHSNGP